MSSKFFTLSIHGADLAAIESLCPDYTVRSISQSWITVVSDNLEWGTTQKEAKRLSKVLPHHILSTEYFDDEYVEFTLYCNGKMVARHVPAEYEGFARSPGKSKVWAEQLGLSRETEKILRVVFKEMNPETCLLLIECVLNCSLRIDAESIDSTSAPIQEYLTEYIERKRAEKKIRNQTKLVLLDEVDGAFSWPITYPVVKVDYIHNLKSFWRIRDGKLRLLFEKKIPESVESFDNDDSVLIRGAFLDRDRFFLEGDCWNIQTHEKEWNIGVGQTEYGIVPPCRLSNGRLAIVYDIMNPELNSYLMSFQSDSSEKKVLELSQFRHWAYPIAYNNVFLMGCGNFLTCYNPLLEELWSVDLGESVVQLSEPFLDDESKILYMSSCYRVTSFDLENRQIRAIRDIADGEYCILSGVLPGTGPVILTGDSSIQVWNSELTPVSRHRAKGFISKIVHQDGKTYVLSGAKEERILKKTENGLDPIIVKPGVIRLYELQ